MFDDPSLASCEEIIVLDVQRSLSLHQNVISQSVRIFLIKIKFLFKTLKSLLMAFAYENREISYCQGMNYIMGFLYIHLKDEEKTFKCFTYLINLYFEDMFTKDLHKLQLLFFQFEKCFALFVPDLADHFKVKFYFNIYLKKNL